MSDPSHPPQSSSQESESPTPRDDAGAPEPLNFVHRPAEPGRPGLDFCTFILSLATSALYHMGAELPDGEKGELNLGLAENSIDTLVLLEEKTRGNLSEQESRILETLLYDLRLRYVELSRITQD